MATLDIAILVCLGISLGVGIWKGLISQLVAVVALLGSAWAAMKFSEALAGWLGGFLTDLTPVVLKVIAFILIFVCVTLIIGILGRILEKCIKLVMLGWVNRLLGAVIAVCVCLLILGLVSVLFDTIYSQYALVNEKTEIPAFISSSMLYEPIHKFGSWVFPYLSKLSV